MFGLDNKSGINAMPPIAPADSQTPKWFTEGGAGLSATYPGQDWFNQIQAELLNVLNAAGIAPQKGNLSQLSSAISKLASTYAISIVHSTGQSLTSVMSQKAVTDALTNAVKEYLKLTGGTLTGPLFVRQDGPAFVILPTTEDGACYVQGRNHNNKAVWFIGNPTDGGTAIYFRNYITGAEVSLHAEGISLNQNTYINGTLGLANYSTFDARYSKIRTVLKSDNGYEKDENTGLIRQWGKTPAFGAGNGSPVRFPIPFPSKCVGVSALPIRDGASSAGSAETIYCGAPGLSGVQLFLGGTINYPVYWEAWGY